MTKTTAWLLVVLMLALMVALSSCATVRPDGQPAVPPTAPTVTWTWWDTLMLGADVTWGVLSNGKYAGYNLLK